jgi:meso-butanediol dehydrogenase / (S,S)-butanediol dehydrogenase / diacetyl reductase
MTSRFSGRVALVTGAASGIGRATAERLASEGAAVFGFDLNAAGLASVDVLAGHYAGDVSSRAECFSAVAACVSSLGRLDVLGNIAGIARAEHFLSLTEEQYRKTMGVNIDGYVWMAQAAIPHLLEAGGNIVNIASNAGLMGQAYTVAYCVSKGAVVQLTRALAMEYVMTPLRVNAIAPGGVETALYANFSIPEDIDWKLLGRYTGLRGSAQATDIAGLFAFIASDEGRNIDGAIISTDGALTAG